MTFRPNEAGFRALAEVTDDMAADLAERIAGRARDMAPVLTGRYRDSIHVERDADGARVVASAPHSAFVEFGTGDTPAFAPLTRARDAGMVDLPAVARGRLP